MPATWPDTLPQRYLVDGNQESIPEGRLKSATDTGPGKMRPRSSALGKPFVASVRMNNAQLDILQAFVATALAGGTLPFTVPAARGGGTWLVRFDPNGSLPSWVNIGGDRYNVSLTLEILP